VTAFVRRNWIGRAAWTIAGSALAIALAPLLRPPVDLLATRLALGPSAARAALSPLKSSGSDPRVVLAALDEDPLLRASQAVYEAALLGRPAGVVRFTPLAAGAGPHQQIVRAVSLVDGLFAAQAVAPRTKHGSSLRRDDIQASIAAAAALTGVDERFLIHTAVLESGLNPYARASTSTGRGLFQFVDQTWLGAVARWGSLYGHGAEARLVRFDRRGRAFVADPQAAREILALRYEPDFAARVAAAMAADNAETLRRALGRPPSAGELYAAHLLGAAGALQLIWAAYIRPAYPAASLLPEAAAANFRLFYRGGAPLSASELLSGFP
jgi:hypothetical protein